MKKDTDRKRGERPRLASEMYARIRDNERSRKTDSPESEIEGETRQVRRNRDAARCRMLRIEDEQQIIRFQILTLSAKNRNPVTRQAVHDISREAEKLRGLQ